MRSSPTAPASQSGYGRDSSSKVNPLGLALCGLATLVAIPVLFFGSRSSVDIDASLATADAAVVARSEQADSVDTANSTATEATASSLLGSVDRGSLLDGGANPSAMLQVLEGDELLTATTFDLPGYNLPGHSALPGQLRSLTGSGGTGSSAVAAAEQIAAAPFVSSSGAAPTTAVPTTAVPTTAVPATAAPATAAPTTPAPTTAPPTTAAPTTAAPMTAAPATAEPAPVAEEAAPVASEPAPDEIASGQPSADDWAELRECEAFGDYTIVSGNGVYHGAYQFSVRTWNAAAQAAGRPELVGVIPSEASAADQDALALNLWSRRGWAPWPHCGRELG